MRKGAKRWKQPAAEIAQGLLEARGAAEFDLGTYDGRRRAVRALERSSLAPGLVRVLIGLLTAGKFPRTRGGQEKPVHEQLRDAVDAIALKAEPGVSAADAGERDRAYRPNRKRT